MAVVEEQGGRPATGTGTAGIVFDTAGEGDPPMLFLHGWCGDRSFFAPQFDHFSRSHWVVGLDLPGHGESRALAAYSIDGLAADVAVEPAAGDRVEDNFNPVGRVYYGFSTLLCIPASLSQEVGLALGRPGWRGTDPRCGRLGRPELLPPGQRDPVQPRVRGLAIISATAWRRVRPVVRPVVRTWAGPSGIAWEIWSDLRCCSGCRREESHESAPTRRRWLR